MDHYLEEKLGKLNVMEIYKIMCKEYHVTVYGKVHRFSFKFNLFLNFIIRYLLFYLISTFIDRHSKKCFVSVW